MSKNNQNKLVPRLRFPEFQNAGEWEVKRLGEVVENITTGKLDANAMTENGQYRFYTCAKNYYKIDHYAFDTEALLIAGNGAHLGYIHHYVGKFNAYQRTYVLSNFSVNVLFLKHFLERFLPFRISREKKDGNTPYIVLSTLTEMDIYVPKESIEQQKIASCLSSLDEVIAGERQKLELLQQHKKGLLQQLFPQEGETVPRLRFPEFQNAGEWEVKKLGEVCKMKAGKFISSSEIYEIQNKFLFPCYGGNGLRGYVKVFNYSGEYPIIGRQGALCGNVTLAQGMFYATEHAVVVTPAKTVNTIWLYYMLGYLNLNQYATGQAQPGLSIDNLEKVELEIPPSLPEQQKIAACLSSLDDLIAAQTEKIELLEQHKKGLLQGLFPKIDDHG